MYTVVFLCGIRDYHAMDWFRASTQYLTTTKPVIVTDLISSEGYPCLSLPEDTIYKLFILDRFLPARQSILSNIYRNFLKLLFLPLQALLLRYYLRSFTNPLVYAHSMYYVWLAWLSGAKYYVATPQGSDILVKPYKSFFYRLLSKVSLSSASLITVDSALMSSTISKLYGLKSSIIQNGIDVSLISKTVKLSTPPTRIPSSLRVCSIRAITSLYRIDDLVLARNFSSFQDIYFDFVYPFSSSEYLEYVKSIADPQDRFLGRLNRIELYHHLSTANLVFSIPSSDSSPRSVYEAIFCGAFVALTYHPFICDLPDSMRQRLIIIDLNSSDWFDFAIKKYHAVYSKTFKPCSTSLQLFDQTSSFKRVHTRLLDSLSFC